jgi:hypothetical protein
MFVFSEILFNNYNMVFTTIKNHNREIIAIIAIKLDCCFRNLLFCSKNLVFCVMRNEIKFMDFP